MIQTWYRICGFPRIQVVLNVGLVRSSCFDFAKIQGVGKSEMKSGELPVIGSTKIFTRPGIYTLEVRFLQRLEKVYCVDKHCADRQEKILIGEILKAVWHISTQW